ncbi:MAG: sigma-70 family RNA polymerase sigma factor [Gammaproteobacteria bacterium]|nr:sigma-70 family RNA polymerase sigma factor [Gammaproteobacteria bacterium]
MSESGERKRAALTEVKPETRQQALDRLYDEHAGALRRFIAVRVAGNLDVEDLVQEVYARLARMDAVPEKLPPGRRSTRAFLLTVANRLVIDRERHRGVRREHDERLRLLQDQDDTGSPSPESIMLARDDLDAVASAIEQLKPQWRRAFVLNRFNNMSYGEVAKTMGVSPKTVEKYIGKALLHLRSVLLGD